MGGLLDSGTLGAHDLAVVEPLVERRAALEAEFPGVAMLATIPPAGSAIIAVKPQHVAEAAREAAEAGIGRLLSIAAGVSTTSIRDYIDQSIEVTVLRAMPNTPALVGQGVIAVAPGAGSSEADLDWAVEMLSGAGLVVPVAEEQLDAVTGLTGSGPAYVFLFAEALIQAGLDQGLGIEIVEPMVSQLLSGSATLLADRGNPAELRRAVTSPGGTTEAGLKVLDEHKMTDTIGAAVAAATERSRELGRE